MKRINLCNFYRYTYVNLEKKSKKKKKVVVKKVKKK